MESIKLADLSKTEIKEMIAKLKERLIIIESNKLSPREDDNNDKTIICDICGGKYTYHNKGAHYKTKKHIREEEYNDSIRRLARSKTIAGRLQIPKELSRVTL
mgnify:CR=1 FL=1